MKGAVAFLALALLLVGSVEASGSGRITVGMDCESEKVAVFSSGDPIHIRGEGFASGDTKLWILELLLRSSPGTKTHYYVGNGQVVIDATGRFCVRALTPSTGYAGYRYTAWVGGKKTQFSIE